MSGKKSYLHFNVCTCDVRYHQLYFIRFLIVNKGGKANLEKSHTNSAKGHLGHCQKWWPNCGQNFSQNLCQFWALITPKRKKGVIIYRVGDY